ncbi:MAG: MAPEG family protein [Novosphingobium sp.]
MQAQILTPVAVLVIWSIVMLFWMAFTRLPALSKLGGLGKAKPGGRGQDLEGVLPDQINWKAHNYSHLMEQPTLFYAAALILAIMGAHAVDVALAWSYVVIRVVHSIWQATVNRVPVRFALFALSSLCLLVLAIRALGATLGHG